MARCKPIEHCSIMLPLDLSEQIVPGSCPFAMDYLVDQTVSKA